MDSIHILILTRLYWPHIGGVEKHTRGRNRLLVKKGVKLTTVTGKYDKDLPSQENIEGETIVRISYPNVKYLGLLFIWYWIFRNRYLIKRADLVHIHDVFIWYLPFRFLFPRKPVYTTFHGWEGVYPVPWKNIVLRKLAAKLSTNYICGGKYIEKYYGIKVNKVILTPFEVPTKINSKKEKRKLVYVGRLHEDTGLAKILESLSILKGFKVDFCGDGRMKDECKKYGKVHGFVNPRPFYEKATISISPGYNAIMEAMAYKCLVITTYNNPLKRDYLKMTPFARWIVIRKTPKKMAEEIKYYTKYPNHAKPLIDGGYDWIKGQTWEKFTDQYLKLWGIK